MGFGQSGFFSDGGGVVGGIFGTARDITSDPATADILRVLLGREGGGQTGFPAPPTFPAVARPVSQQGDPGIFERFLQPFTGGGGGNAFFRPHTDRTRPRSVIMVPDPDTGEPRFFGHLGRCVLFSRDLSAAKKVAKLARRARSGRKR